MMSDLSCAVSSKCSGSEKSDNYELTRIERRKYMQRKVILHAVSKCITQDVDLSKELRDKIRCIILNAEVNPTMNLTTRNSEEKLLGLSELSNVQLSFNEQEKLKEAVNNNLKLMKGDIIDSSSRHERTEDDSLFNLNLQDRVLLDSRKNLYGLQETYMKNLNEIYNLLLQLLQLRQQDLKDSSDRKIDEYSIKSRVYSLRSEMIKEKARIDIFNESSLSLGAYEELLKDISAQQKEYHKEIDELNQLKEKYEFVSCKEYDEILKLYLQYKSALQKKKSLYKQLKT